MIINHSDNDVDHNDDEHYNQNSATSLDKPMKTNTIEKQKHMMHKLSGSNRNADQCSDADHMEQHHVLFSQASQHGSNTSRH